METTLVLGIDTGFRDYSSPTVPTIISILEKTGCKVISVDRFLSFKATCIYPEPPSQVTRDQALTDIITLLGDDFASGIRKPYWM